LGSSETSDPCGGLPTPAIWIQRACEVSASSALPLAAEILLDKLSSFLYSPAIARTEDAYKCGF
jgi:hypothetical protein